LQILNALHDANDLRDLLKLRVLDVLYAMDDPSKRRKLYNSIVSHSMGDPREGKVKGIDGWGFEPSA
jgi:hypothetical protein